MKALVPTHHSRAIARIGDALAQHAPTNVVIDRIHPPRKDTRAHHRIPSEENSDLVVLFVNGLHDHFEALAERCLQRGQRYAVVQIALRTTRQPKTEQWRKLWRGAAAVWSYYPLPLWINEDSGRRVDFNFYHAPLGVETAVFMDLDRERSYTVCTSGARRNQEGVGECDDAAAEVGGMVFQLGPTFKMKAPTTFLTGLSDPALAEMYSRCLFVSGLRRHEGFELPAAEGLICGARPILFDKPHYRIWFDGSGEFVPEADPLEVTRHLVSIFRRDRRPVSQDEKTAASQLFDWATIVSGFWSAVGA